MDKLIIQKNKPDAEFQVITIAQNTTTEIVTNTPAFSIPT
jgi:hypothetical protein